MGVDARTTDLGNEVLAAELAAKYSTLEIPIDDPSYGAADEDTKKIKVETLLAEIKTNIQTLIDNDYQTETDVKNKINATQGELVYSARIYESTGSVTGTANKHERYNSLFSSDFVTSVDTLTTQVRLNLSISGASNDNYEVIVTPSIQGSGVAVNAYVSSNTILVTCYSAVLIPFNIRVYKW